MAVGPPCHCGGAWRGLCFRLQVATQRDIAKALGITQATVSLVFRNSPRVSQAVKERVRKEAVRLGYRPNPYLAAVMSEVRTRRGPKDRGEIALIVDKASREEWFRQSEAFRLYHRGVAARSRELGFGVEAFYLKAPGMTERRIDEILQARGIQGVILGMPYSGNRRLKLQWERYACVASGRGVAEQDCDRVCSDQVQNVKCALDNLRARGYSRAGMILPPVFTMGDEMGMQWALAYHGEQRKCPPKERIPLLVAKGWTDPVGPFRKWYLKWKPDAMLTLVGVEERWVREMKLKIPDQVGIACLVRPQGGHFAGIEPTGEEEGRVAVDRLVEKMAKNEYGIPQFPVQTVIEGKWRDGETVRSAAGGSRHKKAD